MPDGLDIYRPIPARPVVLCKNCKHMMGGDWDSPKCAVTIHSTSYVTGHVHYKRCENANENGECKKFERKDTNMVIANQQSLPTRIAKLPVRFLAGFVKAFGPLSFFAWILSVIIFLMWKAGMI